MCSEIRTKTLESEQNLAYNTVNDTRWMVRYVPGPEQRSLESYTGAARALLEWSQAELAYQARVTTKTIADFERGKTDPYPRTLTQIAEALEFAGVELLNDGAPGVRCMMSVVGQPKS